MSKTNNNYGLGPSSEIDEQEMFSNNLMPMPASLAEMSTDFTGIQLLVVCGVSTAGKDTLVSAVVNKFPEFRLVPRATTRKPRSSEKDGVDYFFSFERPILWSNYAGNSYGITEEVIARLLRVKKGIMIQGIVYAFPLKKLIEQGGGSVRIAYVLPGKIQDGLQPAISVIKTRLGSREDAGERMASVRRELMYIFEHHVELVERGIRFIENCEQASGIDPLALAQLGALLGNWQR